MGKVENEKPKKASKVTPQEEKTVDKVELFIEKLKNTKEYTYKDILDFMQNENLTPEELDKVYSRLEEAGIKVKPLEKEKNEAVSKGTTNSDEMVEIPTEDLGTSLTELEIEPNLEDISEIEKDILLDDVKDFSFIDNINNLILTLIILYRNPLILLYLYSYTVVDSYSRKVPYYALRN